MNSSGAKIVIVADSWRFDYLGCYGNEWIQTPNMDRLARDSMVFENAYAEGCPTVPTRRALLTGRYTLPFLPLRQKWQGEADQMAAAVSKVNELYDRRKDPFQLNNLLADHPKTAAALHEELRQYMLSLRTS